MFQSTPKVVLITGEHCITDEVRRQMDAMYRDPDYISTFTSAYISFDMLSVQNTWDAEPYILYDGETPVGVMKPSFDRVNMHVCSILPRIFPEHRGKGYGSYMFAWCIRNYFSKGWRKIYTQVWANNHHSLALNKKFMIHEAVRPEHQIINGVYQDVHYYGLLKHRYDNPCDSAHRKINRNVEETLGSAEHGIQYPPR